MNAFSWRWQGDLPASLNKALAGLASLFSLFRRDPAGGYAMDRSFLQLDCLAAAPAAPAAGRVRLYAKLSAGGKVELYALFPTGAAQLITAEP